MALTSDIWRTMYVFVGPYLGYLISLKHVGDGLYKVSINCPGEYGGILSDRTFSLEKKEEALEHGKALVDEDMKPILPC